MKLPVAIALSIVILSGCTPYPRYRTGGSEKPPVVESFEGMSTNERLKMGEIMQGYLGRPYKGRSKYAKGVDCSLFSREVFKKFNGTMIPRTVAEQYKHGHAVHQHQLRYGDLVFYRTERNKVSHVGIFVGDERFIHASTSRGVIITGMHETYWLKRYAGSRRVLE